MSFSTENMWLKDYYLSKIRLAVRQPTDNEGGVRLRLILDNNSSHLYVASFQDESGMTPPRFQAELLDNEDPHFTLRGNGH